VWCVCDILLAFCVCVQVQDGRCRGERGCSLRRGPKRTHHYEVSRRPVERGRGGEERGKGKIDPLQSLSMQMCLEGCPNRPNCCVLRVCWPIDAAGGSRDLLCAKCSRGPPGRFDVCAFRPSVHAAGDLIVILWRDIKALSSGA
jgi:hypothetical protein